jgi:hypothetical protein
MKFFSFFLSVKFSNISALNLFIVFLLVGTSGFSSPYILHDNISLVKVHDKTISNVLIYGGDKPCIYLKDCHDIHITKSMFTDSRASSAAIHIVNCYNIYIDKCIIKNSVRGIAAHNCTNNIKVISNCLADFADPNLYNNNGGGNAVQFSGCKGSGLCIDSNLIYERNPNIYIGDQISLYRDTGTINSPIHVWYNKLRGGSTSTAGFAGIVLGDTGGQYQDAEFNIVVSTGTQGMMVAGGTYITMCNNQIYGEYSPVSAAGIMYFNNTGSYGSTFAPSNNIKIAYNKINWTDHNHKIDNAWWNTKNGTTLPEGWATNTLGSIGDYSVTDSILPRVLFDVEQGNKNGNKKIK